MNALILTTVLAAALPAGMLAGDAQAAYAKGCKACHGPTGQGNPAIAKLMSVTLPNLASKDIQSRSDADLKKIALEGKGKMKPVKTIAPNEINDAIAYIRTLK